jgi:hypothetical protein
MGTPVSIINLKCIFDDCKSHGYINLELKINTHTTTCFSADYRIHYPSNCLKTVYYEWEHEELYKLLSEGIKLGSLQQQKIALLRLNESLAKHIRK